MRKPYVLSDRDLDAIMECDELMEPVCIRRIDLAMSTIPDGAGIYVFLRNRTWEPYRIYVGMSERLSIRIREQLHSRRWSSLVLIFRMEAPRRRETLALIEKRILWHGPKFLKPAIWDNERDILAPGDQDPSDWGRYPALDGLTCRMLDEIRGWMYKSRVDIRPLVPTHSLGNPTGKVYGLAHMNGRWAHLLSTSRLSLACSNYRGIWRHPRGCELVSQHLWSGAIQWMKPVLSRPVGLVVMEPIRFPSRSAAKSFLAVGEPLSDDWVALPAGRSSSCPSAGASAVRGSRPAARHSACGGEAQAAD